MKVATEFASGGRTTPAARDRDEVHRISSDQRRSSSPSDLTHGEGLSIQLQRRIKVTTRYDRLRLFRAIRYSRRFGQTGLRSRVKLSERHATISSGRISVACLRTRDVDNQAGSIKSYKIIKSTTNQRPDQTAQILNRVSRPPSTHILKKWSERVNVRTRWVSMIPLK